MGTQGVEPEAIRAALDHIYRRPEFLRAERTTLWERVARWAAEWLRSVELSVPWITDVFLALLAALALFLLVRISLGLVRLLRSRRAATAEARAAREAPIAPEDWRRLAQEAAARGDYLAAVRALYRYAVASLDARGVVRFHESKTGGDYLQECRGSPELAAGFARFLSIVERVVFGGRPCAPPLYRELDGMVEALSRGAR